MGGGFGSFRVHTRIQDGCCRELQAPVGRQQAPTWSLGLLWDVNWSLMDHLRAGRQLGGQISSPVTRSERLMGPPSSPALGASRRSSPGNCMPPSPQRSESRVQIALKGPCTVVSACCTAWWGRQPTVVPKQGGHQGSPTNASHGAASAVPSLSTPYMQAQPAPSSTNQQNMSLHTSCRRQSDVHGGWCGYWSSKGQGLGG